MILHLNWGIRLFQESWEMKKATAGAMEQRRPAPAAGPLLAAAMAKHCM
jgi:hypothetical protein